MNTVLYHNSMKYINNSRVVRDLLGTDLYLMNCNGKTYPYANRAKFDLIVFGSKAKGKIMVEAIPTGKAKDSWDIKKMAV